MNLRPRTVVELFGLDATDARQPWNAILTDQTCPFTDKRCYKVRKSSPEVSIGTCTLSYGTPPAPILICPSRLLDRGQIFTDCLHLLTLHEPGNELHLVPEVKIPGGNVDYFLVSTKNSKVVDFVGIELQTLDTTGSAWPERQRVVERLGIETNDPAVHTAKTFGMNWKMTAKTILVQMHHKASTFEHVNRKLVLVIQNEFLSYMRGEFKFDHFHEPAAISDTVHLHPYGIKDPVDGHRALALGSRMSTDVVGIGEALGVQAETRVELETIVAALEKKISTDTLFSPFNASVAVHKAAPGGDGKPDLVE
ncbi:hypothetical protein LJ757_11705 [Arthrobacter sp. zg-Y453]|uniref:Restriction endonuclease NotI n=1 Tax=Arthrobacter caoxuetaonis TaxID=2886935 RepID=A0A9X1SD81_9MICC|nr:NotI family restriction endonuclease [Arthrobacter caoxuetaonis]MCC3298467.1 hypothetical protein [Arthrobacter caoxuetaonis]USQ57521.1 hypothetical protein NF551_01255 [Arthrobacter caoxuetaonis]